MRRVATFILGLMVGLSAMSGLVWAEEQPNLVTAHETQKDASGYTQIDFTLSEVPEKAMLAFDIRFEARFT